MNKILWLQVIFILFINPRIYAEGGWSSGGGKSVVCRNSDQSIKSVELLDLWEARVLYNNIHIPGPTEKITIPVEVLVKSGIESLKYSVSYNSSINTGSQIYSGVDALRVELQNTANMFLDNSSNIIRRREIHLELTPDSFELAIPDGCEIQQIVIFNYTTVSALLNQDLFDKMNNLNKAALILHESFYRKMRDFGDIRSVRIRRAVAHAISGGVFHSITEFLTIPRITCVSNLDAENKHKETTVHFIQRIDHTVSLLYEQVQGLLMIGLEPQHYPYTESLDKLWRYISRKNNGSFIGRGSVIKNSPVDFDTLIENTQFGDKKMEVIIKSSSSGIIPEPMNLTCSWIEK